MKFIIDKNTYKLIFIGLITGMLASVVGGGAEILIVPLLIYLNVFDDYKTAIGTSLASLLLPIGIVAVYFYSKNKCRQKSCVRWNYAWVISFFFIIGTFFSYFTSKLNTQYLRILFGILLIFFGVLIFIEEFTVHITRHFKK